MSKARNIYQKIWDNHVIKYFNDDLALVYIDLQLLHEVTSPQAFSGMRENKRRVRRPNKNFATMDHSIPTKDRDKPFADKIAEIQVQTLTKNCFDFGIRLFDLKSPEQGIVHIIGPEQGLTQPGMTIVCGDSHTSTHGAFGALAFGIGTSEVEHVLATQSLVQNKYKTMRVEFTGSLREGSYAKDMILKLIGVIGTAGGSGHVIEYCGSAIEEQSIEGRMTICNMSIEAGAKAGIIAPDEKTFEFIHGRKHAPSGDNWDKAVKYWQTLTSDAGAEFDKKVIINASNIAPQVTWGTSPEQVADIDGSIPHPADFKDTRLQKNCSAALEYMGLKGGTKIKDIKPERVFIGSCTNARLEDLKIVAGLVRGKKIHKDIRGMVVPGSANIKKIAEKIGIAKILVDAGFEWRDAGCSMCLGMNEDILKEGERCLSTSNRNFEGRQGKGGRTHLASPAVAAATALRGSISNIGDI